MHMGARPHYKGGVTDERSFLSQPDALFRAAADHAPQAMWIINAKGAVTYLNHAWYELVGGTPPKWYGHEWGEVVDPDDLAEMRARWKVASADGSTFEGRRRVKSQDGTWHTLSYKATPVFDKSGLAGWVGLDADVTELMATAAALRIANQELEAFSYSVSHDLRTPLVTVQGFARLLGNALEGHTDPQARHYLERIGEAVGYMGRLVDGLLTLSQLTRRKLQYEDVDVSALAWDVLRMLGQSDPGRKVTIHVQTGLRVRADGRLMSAVLENLLGNAWKFTSARETAEISVGLERETLSETVFYVKDNGAGFDMEHAGHLFHAFERLHSATEYPGMGIGLATVHRVATRHGGRTWAESAPGEGACFFFALPKS